ncbi:hypothetical protein PIB30_041141 [Stylosanthes scabra]|uniref:Uncharacterized protein n=1 Tax=Stylosanthes scabra TaxID=79078 RepID=A0ABU6SEQ2_9FABA|nr:hypothetical protein [Stylosanthes scabra]
MPQSTISEFSAHNPMVMPIMITHHDQVKDIREKLPSDILALQLQQLIILVTAFTAQVQPPPFLGDSRTAFEILRGNRVAPALSEYHLVLRDPPLKDLGPIEHCLTSTPEQKVY